jgi:hypothetical protein
MFGIPLRLRVLVLIFSLMASSCGSPIPNTPTPEPELPAIFGGNASSINYTCAHLTDYETAGCLEGYEILPAHLRVFVRTNPPNNHYEIWVFACASAQDCPVFVRTVENKETPSPDDPSGTMARFSFLLPRPFNSSINAICASLFDRFPPPSPPSTPGMPPLPPNYQSTPLGCIPFSEKNLGPAGAFRVRATKEGVVVDGWVLNPGADEPVPVEVRRANDSTTVTASDSDTRSQVRWPSFSANHGFQVVLPFVGTGGTKSVCLALPGWSNPTGSDELSCTQYTEAAAFYLEDRAYTVGEKIPFTAEMLDPGARLRFNLFTNGFFLLPWKDADVGTVVADSHGHAEGAIPTDLIPPGDYRLSFLCESGCSAVNTVATGMLDGGKGYPVALGPPFSVVPATAASVSVTRNSKTESLLVEGEDFPPSTPVEVALIYALPLADGLTVPESVQVTIGNDGRFTATIPAAGLPSGMHLVYVVADDDHILASAMVSVP